MAVAGAGELLADIGESNIHLLKAEYGGALPCIIIWPEYSGYKIEASHKSYRLTRMTAEVNIYVEITGKDVLTAHSTAVPLSEKVERALHDNNRLVCTTYPNGFIMNGDSITIDDIDYFSAVPPGMTREVYLCKMGVSGLVILRGAAVSLD